MTRRIVPGTFWVGILLYVGLLLADTVWASKPSDGVPNVVGHWDGFFQEADSGKRGLVRSDFTEQVHRRIVGEGLLEREDGALAPYDLSATVAADDSINGTGKTLTGRLVYHADLNTFAARGGDAAGVQHAQYRFVPARGGASGLDAILLHPFAPDTNAPDISGAIGMGTFSSTSRSDFVGKLAVVFQPRSQLRDDRGAFPGQVTFMPQSVVTGSLPPLVSWDLRATTSGPNPFVTPSGANRFVMIAQGKIGKLVADGVTVPPKGGGNTSLFIGGFYRLQLLDGRTDFGAYNFNIASQFAVSAP
jgi:hypothetical protein